eukprot:GILJ01006930.1.p2 GENE.GILJ01006930.1~~GILJ01006930.1.p2  ORF type:complete len:115 (+),score=21.73 GILJ01006930.1:81-425(+)
MYFDQDRFLNELTRMIVRSKSGGSLWINFKRCMHDTAATGLSHPKKRKADVVEVKEPKCLVRATVGKKKVSCLIAAKDILRFQTALTGIMKLHMDGLKKTVKKDKKQSKKKAVQ